MRCTLALLLALALPAVAYSQNKELQRTQAGVMKVHLGANEGITEGVCDGKGNLYTTVWDSEDQDPSDRPLLKFDGTGAVQAKFDSSRKALNLTWYEDHQEPTALLADGGVARLVWAHSPAQSFLSVAMFSPEGKLNMRIALDPPAIFPSQLVVFPSGEILVSGLEHPHTKNTLGPYKSYTALFDANGHLLRKLSLPEDAEIDADAESGDSRYSKGPKFGNTGITGGAALLGGDGNAYLMRRTSPAFVYVLSASGELVRTLKIEPASHGQLPQQGGMQLSGDRIAIAFSLRCSAGVCGGTNFTVANARTGDKIVDYDDGSVYGIFACYSASPERFTFLTVDDDNKLQRVEAAAR